MSEKNGTNGSNKESKAPDKTKAVATKAHANVKLNGWQRFTKGLAAIPQRIKKSVMNTVAELKKVTWPTRQDLINYSLVVIVFMVFMAILVGVLDLGASALVKLIVRL
ncbi:protein translocase subunit SecE [Clostridia bacterium]|nr:protein translocase subunit SecE [Clostridia bacterium]